MAGDTQFRVWADRLASEHVSIRVKPPTEDDLTNVQFWYEVNPGSHRVTDTYNIGPEECSEHHGPMGVQSQGPIPTE